MAKEIVFDIDARDKLKKGVDALANAVKVTFIGVGSWALMLVSIEFEEVPVPNIVEARLNTTTVPANVQVAFSIVSVD